MHCTHEPAKGLKFNWGGNSRPPTQGQQVLLLRHYGCLTAASQDFSIRRIGLTGEITDLDLESVNPSRGRMTPDVVT